MEYKIGQAVIYDTPYERNCLGFSLSGATLWTLEGEEIETPIYNPRPATEAEILAEIQKHGWATSNILNIDSPSTDVYLQRARQDYKWKIQHSCYVENYEIFGNECLVAYRIITALNLANEKPV